MNSSPAPRKRERPFIEAQEPGQFAPKKNVTEQYLIDRTPFPNFHFQGIIDGLLVDLIPAFFVKPGRVLNSGLSVIYLYK